MVLFVPPSLGQGSSARALNTVGSFDGDLAGPREIVRQSLSTLLSAPRAHLEKQFAARGELLDRAVAANRAVVEQTAPRTAAWRRFDGVVWTHLEPATLTSSQRSRLLIPSALYGVVRASDPVCEYRLGFTSSLAPIGTLSSFWRSELRATLQSSLAGCTVVDLLPNEHALAIDFGAFADVARMRRVQFISFDGERSVGHDAKAAKGRVARTLIQGGWSALRDFEWRGWRAEVRGDIARVRAPVLRIAP